MSDTTLQEMEEQKAILKFFRMLSEEPNEEKMQGDSELSFNRKQNADMSFADSLESRRDSLSFVILPCDGEMITSTSLGHLMGESDSDMTEQQRNNANLAEQQSKTVNAENGETEQQQQSFIINQEPNETADKSSDSGHESWDESALKEDLEAESDPISTNCTNTDCDPPISINTDDSCHEDSAETISNPDVSLALEESETTCLVETATWTGPGPEEWVEPVTLKLEQTPKCISEEIIDENKEGGDQKQEGEKPGEFDLSKDPSSQVLHPPRPEHTTPSFPSSSSSTATFSLPGPTSTRSTFSPGSSTEKQIQLPALFSGLRVLRKGVVGPEHDTVAPIKPSAQGTRRELFPEKVQGSFLDQISLFLSREKRGDEKEKRLEVEAEGDLTTEKTDNEELDKYQEADALLDAAKPHVSSAEAAFDAFKAFFTPKPLKKDPAEKVDLEAVRKKIRADKDALRALFERTSTKTPETKEDCKV